MQAKDFCHWLAGYLDLSEAKNGTPVRDCDAQPPLVLDAYQLRRIQSELRLVLETTPFIGVQHALPDWYRDQQIQAQQAQQAQQTIGVGVGVGVGVGGIGGLVR